ncbi:U3 small nucleolar RNA-associated protein [Physocladia obscura]|uniref:U3 small nucleolar RNA-associated protein n=1 Tax=Physocladia obscura TaxID=109957 RepID=A0AAD5SVI6_9FUNG|nr:U3 small nucleolar RNA-associated protein [Physocladia obscura]
MAYIPANDSLGVSRPLFACVRANGNIEIWDPVYWQLERTIPGIVGGGAIESIVWVLPDENEDDDEDDDDEDLQLETSKDKNKQNKKNKEKRVPLLVTGGLDGMVTLWDISTLTAVSRVESGGGAVWSVAVNELGGSFLALGCEDGAVRIIRVACDFSSGRDSTYALVRASSAASSVSLSGSRVLAVAFQPSKLKQQKPENGEKLEKTDKNLAFTVAAGSADSCIRLYGFSSTSSSNSMYSSRLISRLSVDSTPNNNTLVWSITYLPNGCLVSGDSLGAVCFWDTTSGNNAVLIKSFKAHQADVLCLVANAKGDTVFSSGVDRRVLQFRLIENTSAVSYMKAQKQKRTSPSAAASKIWVLSGDRRFHSHDVRALALCETKPIDCLVSGGIDASLIVTKTIANYPECKQIRQSTFPQKPIVSLATDNTARLVLARFDDHVKLWQLGRVAADQVEDGKSLVGRNRLDLVKNERLLADIKIKCVTNLTASAISPNGMLIAVSDLFATRLFRVSADRFPHSSTITRLKKFQSPELIPGSLAIQFSADSKTLILAGTDSIIRIIDVSNNEFSLVAAFTEHLYEHKAGKNSIGRGVKRELVDSLAISQDNQWLATADLANNIFIFNLDNLKLHTTLPHVKAMHTSIAFNSNSANLTVTLASNEILVYDVEHARLSPWSRQNSHMLPEKFLNRTDIIMGTESSSAIPNKLVVWGPEYICSIDTSVQLAKDVKSKNKRKYDGGKKTATAVNGKFMDDNNTDNENEEQDDSSKNGKQGFSMQFNYGPMMFFGLLSGGREAVVVERPILSVIEALPMSFYRRKYAT